MSRCCKSTLDKLAHIKALRLLYSWGPVAVRIPRLHAGPGAWGLGTMHAEPRSPDCTMLLSVHGPTKIARLSCILRGLTTSPCRTLHLVMAQACVRRSHLHNPPPPLGAPRCSLLHSRGTLWR